MFQFPASSEVNKAIPKSKFYAQGTVNSRTEALFVSQVAKITWLHKLAEETLNLSSRNNYTEIQVFRIELKPEIESLDHSVLSAMDKAIPFPLLFELRREATEKVHQSMWVTAFKRPHETRPTEWVTESYQSSVWQNVDVCDLNDFPIATDIYTLYEKLLEPLLSTQKKPDETLVSQVQRLLMIETLQRKITQLKGKIHREKQYNRKIKLNRELKELKAQLADLL